MCSSDLIQPKVWANYPPGIPREPTSAREKRRGRRKRGRVLALISRFKKRKASVCLFIENFAVPFDNNQAERDLRMVKVKTKVSGCFRTDQGARDFLRIMAYVGIAKSRV